MTEPVWVRFSSAPPEMARAMPKSATFTCPAAVIRMLPGFTSRWTTPLRWAKPRAAATSAAIAGGGVRRRQALAAEDVGQARAVDVLHDDVVGAALLAPVVDTDDVGVVEVGGGLCLPPEALDERRVAGELREQHLDRDRPVEQQVAGEEDLGHAPPRDPALDLVAAVEDERFLYGHPRFSVRRTALAAAVDAAVTASGGSWPSPPWRSARPPGRRSARWRRAVPRRSRRRRPRGLPGSAARSR